MKKTSLILLSLYAILILALLVDTIRVGVKFFRSIQRP